jgi:two-component system, OmpR family, sensor histidine kinase KdpD
VLTNLLENADRHGPPGSEITVQAEPDGDSVRLSVTDRGPGVPAADRESVFESFVRFDTGGRAGLGLALAKTFVDAHGGRIWVEDAAGGGARFVFTMPVSADGDGR